MINEFDELDELDDLIEDDTDLDTEELDIATILKTEPNRNLLPHLSSYLAEIARFPRISNEEEIALAKIMAATDTPAEVKQAAREKFINANYKLVVSIAKRYTKSCNAGITFLDLIQSGNLGLMKSVDRFDYTKGIKFSTFATWWIRQSITRDLLNMSHTIRIPVHLQEQVSKIFRLQREAGRDLSPEELMEALDLTANQIQRILHVRDTMQIASLDRLVVNEDSSTSLLELIADGSLSPDEVHTLEEREQGLVDIMGDRLTDREFYILVRRFGLRDNKPVTLEHLGNELGVTRERIRQIEAKALRKLRTPRVQARLRDLLQGE